MKEFFVQVQYETTIPYQLIQENSDIDFWLLMFPELFLQSNAHAGSLAARGREKEIHATVDGTPLLAND